MPPPGSRPAGRGGDHPHAMGHPSGRTHVEIVKADHLVVPHDRIKRIAKRCGLALLLLAIAVGCFAAGRGCRVDDIEPPAPVPTPTPVGDLRVILVSDSSAPMSKGQLSALSSTAVRAYLNKHCGQDPDGRPAWRSWDKDIDDKGESERWREAWDAAKPMLGALPQVVVFVGQKGKALPLPDSEAGLLELLKKYGGN